MDRNTDRRFQQGKTAVRHWLEINKPNLPKMQSLLDACQRKIESGTLNSEGDAFEKGRRSSLLYAIQYWPKATS